MTEQNKRIIELLEKTCTVDRATLGDSYNFYYKPNAKTRFNKNIFYVPLSF